MRIDGEDPAEHRRDTVVMIGAAAVRSLHERTGP